MDTAGHDRFLEISTLKWRFAIMYHLPQLSPTQLDSSFTYWLGDINVQTSMLSTGPISQEEIGPRWEFNIPQEIFTVFDSLDGVF